MEKFIITVPNAAAEVPVEKLLSELHLDKPGTKEKMINDIVGLYNEGIRAAKPVALYSAFVPELRDKMIIINGIALKENFVYEMLSPRGIVVPFVASCGREIDCWSKSLSDMYLLFAADVLKELCLDAVRNEMKKQIEEKHLSSGKSVSAINPGSLPAWPITGQKPLFDMLGGVTEDIGVKLSDGFMVSPTKSVSGIMFETDEEYHNCQLCQRADCPRRTAPYSG